MKIFSFRAVDEAKKNQKGVVYAHDKEEGIALLSRCGMTVTALQRAGFFTRFFSRKLSPRDKLYLARNLYIILKSGLSITQGARILIRDLKSGPLKSFLIHLVSSIEKGEPIYKSFEAFPDFFNEIDVQVIKIGEYSGNLTQALFRWSEDVKKNIETQSSIASALVYPAIILAVACAVIVLIVTFVMPKIADLVSQMGTDVPKFTKVMLTISLFVGEYLWYVVGGIVGFIVALVWFALSRKGKQFFLHMFTVVPPLSSLAEAMALRNFCFLLKSLLTSGINLAQALDLIEHTMFHPVYKKATGQLREKIIQGVDVSDALMSETAFPGSFSGILGIASRTGSIIEVLGILQEFYEEDVKTKIRNLLALIEPLMLIFLGLLVGGIAISVLVPIYQQISAQMGGV